MTERKKARSFSEVVAEHNRKEGITRLLHDFEVEFQVYKIRKSDEMRGIANPIRKMLLDLLEVYQGLGYNPSNLLENLSDPESLK